ncbi:MAG: hypothetical protein A2V69_02490 [Candidatus Portnoybacteria bacterium RBG_13_40_8]|uniref:TrbC/VIRB2 family protein n=1 Tax=Candidatus Portnoybacteria bacterium RBG_13_40_8 TaxID=1801990 RepID=A0A1G2F2L4_9BACT|nr:MAG: hypothetical protein A2V69_02490 [Candidatus Portnoybacteria bacterium RBG_13_40_8]OGZ34614.1 MAG: hypothetical protein A2V60_00545 [Candidatus Portnoybacteria bacterium RIFCSPHIGHO2_01_FULL_39_19]
MKKYLVIGLFALALPLVASAQVDPVVAICNILEVIQTILLAIGLGIAVIVLILGGIRYLTSGGDAEKAGSAKNLIINAIIGIIIILAAAFLLALVQGLLVRSGIDMMGNPCT